MTTMPQSTNSPSSKRADRAKPQQIGNRPAAGERGAEHFGTDEDGRADDGQHVFPEDAARPLRRGRVQGAALSSKLGPDSGRTQSPAKQRGLCFWPGSATVFDTAGKKRFRS